MYETILDDTLKILKELPTPVPETGEIAGIVDEYTVDETSMFAGDDLHFPMGSSFLTLGVVGVAAKASSNAENVSDAVKKELLEDISVVYTELSRYFLRYAETVYRAADGDERLSRIARRLEFLSGNAPVHFDEALQLYYLMWKTRCLFIPGGDIGRLDVHLQPFFERDIASGYTDEDTVLSLLCRFWELLNLNCSGDTLTNVMVGGRNADGTDVSGRLSFLMLRATKLTHGTEPHINVRVHPTLREDVRHEMLEVQLMGEGQATVYNDEVIIPALVNFGIPEELACLYANDGCTEIVIDGASAIDFRHIDAVATFELAFNDGDFSDRTYCSPIRYVMRDNEPKYYAPQVETGRKTGRIEDCRTFDEFYAMFLAQYEHQVRYHAGLLKELRDSRMAGAASSILLNGTFDCVLESGTDIRRGGLPIENYMLFSGSIPTAADCLIAVKELIFDKKLYTVAEVKEAIRVNFSGHEDMRQAMLSVQKFGCGKDEVDLLSADIAEHFCDFLADYRRETGFAVFPALIGWRFLEEAYGIAATPDGRRYGDPIAEHYCATPGRAVNGPTALIGSVAKAKSAIAKAVGVSAVQVSLPGNLRNGKDEGLSVLDGIVMGAVSMGLSEINVAIYDEKALREAQKDPESHRDLIVRVWGYCARFTDLCTEMQDHVIARAAGEKQH